MESCTCREDEGAICEECLADLIDLYEGHGYGLAWTIPMGERHREEEEAL